MSVPGGSHGAGAACVGAGVPPGGGGCPPRPLFFPADITAFPPAASGRLERLLVEQLREGVASRTMLVAIEGGAPAELARLSRGLARALAADRRFDYVTNGAAEFTQEARELGLNNRYLLSRQVTPRLFATRSREAGG